MVEAPPHAVNLAGSAGSTITGNVCGAGVHGVAAARRLVAPTVPALAAWLRARSAQLPRRFGLSMRLMPPRCLFCGQAGDLGRIDLCSDCLEALPPLVEAGDRPRFGTTGETMELENWGIELESALVPFLYAPPTDAALRALKFHGDLAPAQVFGALLAGAAACRGEVPDLLVPVPLHADRLHERGFNQAARIARAAGLWLGRPCAPQLLSRRRSTPPQTSLAAAARRANLHGAFELAGAPCGGGRPRLPSHVALVDDVLTTGATMAAAVEALQVAEGLRRVSCWAVARPASGFLTPEPCSPGDP
ncbi:MAG: ComF family protein [Steroidobacteraceae bacterium]|jgi:ComF family protein|nr:ComF family protein [Steroidobacteraceae bacterium]